MGELAIAVTLDAPAVDAARLEHQIQQQPRAGAGLAVDEAHIGAAEILQRGDLLRIAGAHEDALRANRQLDQAMGLGANPRGKARQHFPLEFADRHVEAGNVAGTLRKCCNRLKAAAVLQVVAHLVRLQEVMQRRHREAMAGVQAQRGARLVDQFLQFDFQFRCQAFQRGGEPRGNALAGPHQLLRQRRERAAAPAGLGNQRAAEQGLRVAQDAPGVAVGQAGGLRRLADAACALDMPEQGHQAGHVEWGAGGIAVVADLEVGQDRDANHMRKIAYCSNAANCL